MVDEGAHILKRSTLFELDESEKEETIYKLEDCKADR